jgi:hypothetical protein
MPSQDDADSGRSFDHNDTFHLSLEKFRSRDVLERLVHLEEGLQRDRAERKKTRALLEEVISRDQKHQEILEVIEKIVSAGIVLRWLLVGIIGVLSTVGLVVQAMDYLQKYLSK